MHIQTRLVPILLAAAVFGLCACEKQPEPTPVAGSGTPAATGSNPAVAPPAQPAGPTAAGGETMIAGVGFKVPEGWKQVPPANQMRLAEMVVPDPSGDASKDCSITFSSAGGDVQSNVSRWATQMADASGQVPAAPIVDKEVGGFKVHTVEIKGSFKGMTDPAPKTGWMLRGAIIETADQPLFIKMTGPEASMQPAAAGWQALIDSIRKP